MIIQSVIFSKKKWTIKKAVDWLRQNDLKFNKIDIEQRPNFISFRQQIPLRDVKYFTKKLGLSGIEMIFMT